MKTIHEIYFWFCCGDSWTHLGYGKLRQRWKHCYLRCVCRCVCARYSWPKGNPNWYKSYSTYFLELAQAESLWSPSVSRQKFLMGSAECIFPYLSVEKKTSCQSKRLYFLSGSIFDWQMTKKNEPRELRPIFSWQWKSKSFLESSQIVSRYTLALLYRCV